MGLWEAMRARTQPKRNNLDALFHVPSAAITPFPAMTSAVSVKARPVIGGATSEGRLISLPQNI